MKAVRIIRRLRVVMWSVAALGLVLIVAWRVGVWNPSPRSVAGNSSDTTNSSPEPGLAIYPAPERARAPELDGNTLTGKTFSLSDLAGNIVVVNVWGSWCAPCRAETPELVRLSHQYASRGVRFVGINTRDNPAAAKSFVKKFHVPYPSVVDDNGRLLLNFRHIIPTAVVPSSVIIDRHYKVAARVIGRVDYTTLKGLLNDEIAASGGRR